MYAGIALCLITAQILAGGFVTVQSVVSKGHSFRANKCISLQVVRKAVPFRRIGELNCGDMASNPQQLQTTMNSAGFIATIQRYVFHGNTKLYLSFQMAQHLSAFLLICAVHINSGHNAVFAIYG